MIKTQTINGQQAVVSYLDKNFNPVDEQSCELVKVVFDDGNILFGTPARPTKSIDLYSFIKGSKLEAPPVDEGLEPIKTADEESQQLMDDFFETTQFVGDVANWHDHVDETEQSDDEPVYKKADKKSFSDGLYASLTSRTDSTKTVKKETIDGVLKFVLWTKDGKRKLGTHDTYREAMAQEKAIEMNKK